MPIKHTIVQGEYLTKIALKYGIPADTIWNDPYNAQLKQKRKSPHVLLPGDVLYIRDKADKNDGRATDSIHTYVVPRKTITLKLTLLDWDQTPIASTPCILHIDSQIIRMATDGSGKIEKEITVAATTGTLKVRGYTEEFQIQVGSLDPSSEATGLQGRLRNLAYLPNDDRPPDPDTLNSAVQEFQCNAGISVDGIVGPQTLSTLEKTHGA